MLEEKRVFINGFKALQVNYKVVGSGKQILILHGWGSSSDSWVKIQQMIAEKGFQAIALDLPGFGKTEAPREIWGVEEYANFVNQFAEQLGLAKFVLTGHSFGGQTAIQFAVQHPEKVEKLVLIAAAGVRRTPGVAKKLVMAVAKLVSFLLYLVPFEDLRNNIRNAMYMLIRRRDYVRTQGIMREIFKKVIMHDLTAKFSKIQAPTLIVWGDRDELTPVQDAYLMHELIPNSKLEIISGGKHALNFQMPEKLSNIIAQFLS
ncbi:MAG: alpha/beta hydrolase [Patescibacteria group bacterium]